MAINLFHWPRRAKLYGMSRWGIAVAGVVVFALVASQVLIPPLGESRVEDRLEAGGGTAEVTLGAVPAVRLLFGDGERLEVRAHDLDLPLDLQQRVFERLDGFGIVDVAIANSKAGPFELDNLTLTRTDSDPYHLVARGTTTAADLVDYGFGEAMATGETLLDSVFEVLFGPSNSSIPVSLDMQLASDDGGRVNVVSGDATVAGLPAGPFAEVITSAIVVRL
jgi:hypothetical protein